MFDLLDLLVLAMRGDAGLSALVAHADLPGADGSDPEDTVLIITGGFSDFPTAKFPCVAVDWMQRPRTPDIPIGELCTVDLRISIFGNDPRVCAAIMDAFHDSFEIPQRRPDGLQSQRWNVTEIIPRGSPGELPTPLTDGGQKVHHLPVDVSLKARRLGTDPVLPPNPEFWSDEEW